MFFRCKLIHIDGVREDAVLSRVRLFANPRTVAHQAPLSTGFPRQEYLSGVPFPPPGDLPNPEIELISVQSPALTGGFFTTSTTWEALFLHNRDKYLLSIY